MVQRSSSGDAVADIVGRQTLGLLDDGALVEGDKRCSQGTTEL